MTDSGCRFLELKRDIFEQTLRFVALFYFSKTNVFKGTFFLSSLRCIHMMNYTYANLCERVVVPFVRSILGTYASNERLKYS